MSAHDVLFLEPELFEVQPPLTAGGCERVCFQKGEGVQLRRMLDDESKYAPDGTYRESWVKLPNWKAAGLQYLYGFSTEVDLEGEHIPDKFGGSISFRLSNDNGTSWLFYDGASWSPVATDADWNTQAEVDLNLDTFPVTAFKEIKVQVKLTPTSNGKATPFLRKVTTYGMLQYDLQDDLMRSLKHWVEQYVWIKAKYYGSLENSDTVDLTDKKWGALSGPATAYNNTTDPNHTTNLFNGFGANTILLTSKQTGLIEASFMASPPVYFGAEEFIQLSSIPSIVINLQSLKERRDLRRGSREVSVAFEKKKALIQLSRVWFDAEFRLSCQSDLQHEAVSMTDSLNEALTYRRFVLSEQTGEFMPVPYASPFTQANRIAQGLYVKDYVVTLFGKAWLRPDQSFEEDLAQEIRVLAHPYAFSERYEES